MPSASLVGTDANAVVTPARAARWRQPGPAPSFPSRRRSWKYRGAGWPLASGDGQLVAAGRHGSVPVVRHRWPSVPGTVASESDTGGVARKTYAQLLDEIHDGALDSLTNLPDLLRKCIALGGETGSERLRDWARQELMGYGPGTEVPEYRKTTSLLYLDGATFRGLVRGQQVPLTMIPSGIRDKVRESMNNIEIRQPVAELVDIVESHRKRGEGSVKLAPPLVQELVTLINHELHAAERRNDPFPSPVQLPPSQTVERVYWEIGINTFAAAIDAVRTALVQLVVEIRAVAGGAGAPSRDAAEQAVDIALYGKARVRNLVINQVAAGGQGAVSGSGPVGIGSEPESRSRRWMWWVVAVATVAGAVATVILLLA